MDKTIVIGLSGHAERFQLDETAYDRLTRYLDAAGARLRGDPDRAEVLSDLEQSIGDKLAAVVGADDRVVTAVDIDGVLEAVGAVDTGQDPPSAEATTRPPGRRLHRIREGQSIAGVCTGISAYSEIRVDWVRTVVVLGTIFTGGLLGLVYIALAFILPITETREK